MTTSIHPPTFPPLTVTALHFQPENRLFSRQRIWVDLAEIIVAVGFTLLWCQTGLQAQTTSAVDAAFANLTQPWTNSLSMRFLPVTGTKVLFGVWDVRVQDYAVFVQATGHESSKGMWSLRHQRYGRHGDTWQNPGFTQGPTHPVCGVNWDDAQAFCQWLTAKERAGGKISAGQSYHLPADWEWSVAAGLNEPRAGTPKDKDEVARVYPWGTSWPPPNEAGNYAGEDTADENWPREWKVIEGRRDGFARTSPVGSFAANKFGLYDMGGNVWQWCEDDYDGFRGNRTLRGGSWAELVPRFLLSSFRLDFPAAERFDYSVGFRVVLADDSSR
jgi:formylglycine-generating enzyme required for sulfatase activity